MRQYEAQEKCNRSEQDLQFTKLQGHNLEVKLHKHNYTNYTVTFKGRGLHCIPKTSLCFINKFWQDKV